MKKTTDNKDNKKMQSAQEKEIENGTAERIRRFIEKLIFSPLQEENKAEPEDSESVKAKSKKKSLQVTGKNQSDSSRNK